MQIFEFLRGITIRVRIKILYPGLDSSKICTVCSKFLVHFHKPSCSMKMDKTSEAFSNHLKQIIVLYVVSGSKVFLLQYFFLAKVKPRKNIPTGSGSEHLSKYGPNSTFPTSKSGRIRVRKTGCVAGNCRKCSMHGNYIKL